MKKLVPHPAIIFRSLFWLPVYFLRSSFKRKTAVILILSFFSLSACFKNFYLTNTKYTVADSVVAMALKNPNKYFIIHFKDAELALENVSASGSIIEGDLEKIAYTSRLLYHSPAENS